MMDSKKIVEALHPLERKVLPALRNSFALGDIVKTTRLSEVEVMRALMWLSNKKLVEIKEQVQAIVSLGENGLRYREQGLPEKKLLAFISDSKLQLNELEKNCGLTREEFSVALGTLRGKNAIEITKEGKDVFAKASGLGKKFLERESFEEKFIKRQFPIALSSLTDTDKLVLDELKKRKDIIKIEEVKVRSVSLTELGRNILLLDLKEDAIDRLTTHIIASGEWRTKPLRRYDVLAEVPRIHPGRKQHYREYLDEVREKFIGLGFQEMSGPVVETDFWNMDALFMPQFHSARDIHDAYYIKEPKYSKSLPLELVNKVKNAHETGFGTGSKGWRYDFDVQRTHRHLLRTQGTACSTRMLASPNLKIPGKYFAIARCFRKDVIDATHLADFFQTEGIVVEKGLTLRHLIGLLKLFAQEFAGTAEVKVIPSYFPFTEPSASLYAKHPQMGWIELGGSGIFRPEMTKPFG
ncbi:MAG: phenylalanine--tRNA ligase subunit alpha, partial [Nanoarchaeota archaeon]